MFAFTLYSSYVKFVFLVFFDKSLLEKGEGQEFYNCLNIFDLHKLYWGK